MGDENAGPQRLDGNIANLRASVAFDLPFCLYLEDGDYDVERGGWNASVRLERVTQTELDPRLGTERASTEFVRDRFGRLRYSRVIVSLPGQAIVEQELRRQVDSGNMEATEGVVNLRLTLNALLSDFGTPAFDEALGCVNRLIEVYRYVTDQFHVHRVPSDEIFKADIKWYELDDALGGTLHMNFGRGMTLEPIGFDDNIVATLRSWLNSDTPVPLAIELFQDAANRLDLSEYRLAVIDARTALEVLIDGVLLGYLDSSGSALDEACRLLNVPPAGVDTVEEALQQSAINRKLGHACTRALGLDLHDGHPDLWLRWLSAKDLREQGVHRGAQVEKADAIAAVNAMGEIMEEIRQALGSAAWIHDPGD